LADPSQNTGTTGGGGNNWPCMRHNIHIASTLGKGGGSKCTRSRVRCLGPVSVAFGRPKMRASGDTLVPVGPLPILHALHFSDPLTGSYKRGFGERPRGNSRVSISALRVVECRTLSRS